jgi:hypothetical protein
MTEITMNETQRTRRGHDFLPPAAELAEVPGLYETDGIPAEAKLIPLHYFAASGDWWIAEIGTDDGQLLAFGYAKLAVYPDGEWGYVDLAELEEVNVHHGLVVVERDLHWQPRKFADITEARR